MPGLFFMALLSLMKEPQSPGPAIGATIRSETLLSALNRNAKGYALLFFGMSGVTITLYAMLSWISAVLQREHHWTPGEVGQTYGLIVLVAAPLGLLLGGILNDLLTNRGRNNAPVLIAGSGALLALPLMLAVGAAPGPIALLGLVAVLHFLLAMPIGIVPAYIQLITAPAVRARVSAAYVLVVNIVGLGVGPTLIGAISSMSPNDPAALRLALVGVTVPFLALAAGLLLTLARRDGSSTDGRLDLAVQGSEI